MWAAIVDAWETLPTWAQVIAWAGVVVAVLSIGTATWKWFDKRRIIGRIQTTLTAPDAPQLDPQRSFHHYQVQEGGPVLAALENAEFLLSKAKAKRERRELLERPIIKTINSERTWIDVCLMESRGTDGLDFLPEQTRHAVLLALVQAHLLSSGAPKDAIREVQDLLEKLEEGAFYQALFSTEKLRVVDLTPEAGRGVNYFTKYLQPLTLALQNNDFVESAGGEIEKPQNLLREHLRYLAKNQVAAAWVTHANNQSVVSAMRAKLPRELPGPKSHQRAQAIQFNRNQAVKSALVVCKSDAMDPARSLEYQLKVEKRFSDAELSCRYWTPRHDQPGEQNCFLWQQSKD